MVAGGFIGLMEFSGRLGLFPGCEGAIDFSIQRPGAELRCALVRPAGPSRFSLATSTAVANSPYGSGLWGRFGLEAGRRLFDVDTMLDVDVSFGPERHGMRTDAVVGPAEDAFDNSGGGPHAFVVRNEVRLSVPIGVAIPLAEARGLREGEKRQVIVGIVPFVVLASPGLPRTLGCVECSNSSVSNFDVPYGATLTAAYAWEGAIAP
jgi:hypothetical protein